jgi:hypothetical protein
MTNHIAQSFRLMSLLSTAFALLFGISTSIAGAAEFLSSDDDEIESLVGWLLEEDRELSGIPFPQVIQATTGNKVIPLTPTNIIDSELLDKLCAVMDNVQRALNAPDHPAHAEARINEVSAHFETALREQLNAVAGFTCAPPKTASGVTQRSGYPDLRLEDQASGRVLYIDPKIFAERNRTGSLRTFYFEPKRETNKILEDAHHLIVGFEHSGKRDGHWVFTHWNISDLAHFKVRLKAEFQGSNQDLYRQETVVRSSRETDGKQD